MTHQVSTPDLLNSEQARTLLHCSRASLDRWVKAGKISPTIQLPGIRGARLFARADVEALAAERAS
jgi:predicted site-specific integrase-resolvase